MGKTEARSIEVGRDRLGKPAWDKGHTLVADQIAYLIKRGISEFEISGAVNPHKISLVESLKSIKKNEIFIVHPSIICENCG